MEWSIITALELISPLILFWGWVRYLRLPSRSDWRSRASLIGLSAPLLSGAVWLLMLLIASAKGLHASTSTIQHLITFGAWIPIVGMIIGLTGRPLLIAAIVPSSVGALLFWYATTLP